MSDWSEGFVVGMLMGTGMCIVFSATTVAALQIEHRIRTRHSMRDGSWPWPGRADDDTNVTHIESRAAPKRRSF